MEESVKHNLAKNVRSWIDMQSRNVYFISCYIYKQKKHL